MLRDSNMNLTCPECGHVLQFDAEAKGKSCANVRRGNANWWERQHEGCGEWPGLSATGEECKNHHLHYSLWLVLHRCRGEVFSCVFDPRHTKRKTVLPESPDRAGATPLFRLSAAQVLGGRSRPISDGSNALKAALFGGEVLPKIPLYIVGAHLRSSVIELFKKPPFSTSVKSSDTHREETRES